MFPCLLTQITQGDPNTTQNSEAPLRVKVLQYISELNVPKYFFRVYVSSCEIYPEQQPIRPTFLPCQLNGFLAYSACRCDLQVPRF